MSETENILFRSNRFHVEEVTESLRDGTQSSRHVVRHPGAVAIVPVLDDGRVCLIRNRRVSVDRQLIEIPAGTLEPPEDPKQAAFRELTEETGYRASTMTELHSFLLSPGIMDERMHLYVATGLEAGSQELELDEYIENLVVPLEEAMTMCYDGRIEDAKTLVGLMRYAHYRGASVDEGS